MASSTVRPFNTGSTPGNPRQIGCTLWFGSSPYATGAGLKSFELVRS
jgi:hypothetical protein